MQTLDEYIAQAGLLAAQGTDAFKRAQTPEELEAARVEFLGDRRGRLLEFQRALGVIPKEDRPAAGRRFNSAKQQLEQALEARRAELGRDASAGRPADLTM